MRSLHFCHSDIARRIVNLLASPSLVVESGWIGISRRGKPDPNQMPSRSADTF